MRRDDKILEERMILVTTILLLGLIFFTLEKTVNVPFSSLTGQVASRVYIIPSPPAYCNFTLYTGNNLVSFFCITTDADLSTVIGSLSNMQAIFDHEPGVSDYWKSYNPDLPAYVVSDLTTLHRSDGYWIVMDADENFLLNGSLRVPTNVFLVSGWNLVGYPTNSSKNVTASFATIQGNFTEARAFNATTQSLISYIPGSGGALNETRPPMGFWINATTTEVWIVE